MFSAMRPLPCCGRPANRAASTSWAMWRPTTPCWAVDVVVADGFTGNVMLKTLEGTAKFLMKELKNVYLTNGRTKLGAMMVKREMAGLKRKADPAEIGGTPFLGISKPVIKAHGGSDANAIKNAILRAKEYAESGFIEEIEKNIDYMRVKPAPEKV